MTLCNQVAKQLSFLHDGFTTGCGKPLNLLAELDAFQVASRLRPCKPDA